MTKIHICGFSSEFRQWIAAIIANSTIFVMGMSLGWSSPVITELERPNGNTHMTDDQISWIISSIYIGSIASPLPTGLIMDRFGRKMALYFTAIMGITSWVLLLVSDSVVVINASRIFGGIVGGCGMTVVPVYVGEIAKPGSRGGMGALFITFMFSGIVFEYILGPLVPYKTYNIISLGVLLVLTSSLLIVPESPYYYTMRGNRTKALSSLTWLRCSETMAEVETELNNIEKTISENMKNKKSPYDLILSRTNRRALLLAETLAIIQRSSGISAIIALASAAAPSSWVITNNQCAVLIGITWIIFSLISSKLVDRLGRKVLFVSSCLATTVAQLSYGTYAYLKVNTNMDLSQYDWCPFAALVLFSASYTMGLGCVPVIIQGEMFPADVKGVASGVTAFALSATSFIMNKMYQPISDQYGVYVNYWIYTFFCIFGVIFGSLVLVETKGKSLLDIQKQLCRN